MDLKNIVAAVDFSDTSLLALETAFSLASETGATLHLLHVLDEHLLAPIGPLRLTMAELREQRKEQMERLIPENWDDSVPIRRMVIEGDPASAVAEFALDHDADMIVAGTHGRKGVARVLMGSTAEKLLREAPCQILIVKSHKSAVPESSAEAEA